VKLAVVAPIADDDSDDEGNEDDVDEAAPGDSDGGDIGPAAG
jgi:hypothetical protein